MKLAIAEQFYSIQGEGRYAGAPAVFLRLAGCNLLCGGVGTDKDKLLHDGATWRCDTIEVWKKGRAVDILSLIEKWAEDGTLEHFKKGAHLIITGGEPLLQQQSISALLLGLADRLQKSSPFIEIETNGTIESKLTSSLILRYNCSPKLSNSGMPKDLRALAPMPIHTDYKFVVSRKQDIEEVLDIVERHRILSHNVFLMPATDNRETLIDVSQMVAEACKACHFWFSSRHQVMIWDKTTGV
jgi:7-carboxy-7-deazaguanine synthase